MDRVLCRAKGREQSKTRCIRVSAIAAPDLSDGKAQRRKTRLGGPGETLEGLFRESDSEGWASLSHACKARRITSVFKNKLFNTKNYKTRFFVEGEGGVHNN